MRQTRDLMISSPTTLHSHESVAMAREEMNLGNIRHLPIIDRQGALVGVLSDRDLSGATDDTAPVSAHMSEDVLTAAPDTPLTEVAFLFLSRRIGCLPITDEHTRLVGIITESDFVRLAYIQLGGADLDQRLREESDSERE